MVDVLVSFAFSMRRVKLNYAAFLGLSTNLLCLPKGVVSHHDLDFTNSEQRVRSSP